MNKNKAIAFVLSIAVLAVLAQILPSYWVGILTLMVIYAIFAMSLDILMGYMQLPSFGHAAFFGVASYTIGVMTTKYDAGFMASVGMAVLLSTATAAVFGLIVSHMKGVYFLMTTLALGMVTWGLAFRWTSMTGGDNGLSGVPRPDFGETISMWDEVNYFYFTLIVFVVVFLVMLVFVKSPFGRSMEGIRESDSRMRILGYNVWLHKYLGYVAAGFFAGISGVLWAYYNGFISVADTEIDTSFLVFLMVILGGPGTLIGPAVGGGIIIFLQNFISGYWDGWLIAMGLIYILTVIFLPKGLFGLHIGYVEDAEGRRKLKITTP